MKRYFVFVLLPLLAGCAGIAGDQWRWMDDPEAPRWVQLEANFDDLVITFQVPARADGFTSRVRSSRSLFAGTGPVVIEVPVRTVFQATGVSTFQWDYWWGGFMKGSGADFVLSVSVSYYGAEESRSFLDMPPLDFIDWRRDQWIARFTDSDGQLTDSGERFFRSYGIDVHESANGLKWALEKWPLTNRSIDLMVPLSEDHVLHFDFFINEESRGGLDPDPAWAVRRWQMAYRILDTVEITPRRGRF